MIDINVVTFAVIFAGLIGAIVWDLITWYFGLPTSSSHALIGGYAGAAVAKAGFGAIIAARLDQDAASSSSSRRSSAWSLGLRADDRDLLDLPVARRRRASISWFRRLQLVSAAAYSLSHGANDAQKTMGIIAGVLFAAGYIDDVRHPVLGDPGGARGDRPRHAGRRLAHHPHDGIEDHQAAAGRRLRRGDRRRRLALHRDAPRRAGQHDPHDHRRDRRRRRDAAAVGRALGRRRPDRLGVGADDSRGVRDRRRRRTGCCGCSARDRRASDADVLQLLGSSSSVTPAARS